MLPSRARSPHICEHHDWEIVSYKARPDCTTMTLDVNSLPDIETDLDDDFSTLKTEDEQFAWALNYVLLYGTDGFFDNCYGKCNRDADGVLRQCGPLSADQFLVDMFYILKNFGRLPGMDDTRQSEGDETVTILHRNAINQLKTLKKGRALPGIKLNAISRCLTQIEQDRRDALRSLGNEKTAHTMIRSTLGARLRSAAYCAQLLGVRSLFEDCELPQGVVDIANRESNKEGTRSDDKFMESLRSHCCMINDGSIDSADMRKVLNSIAKGCGMELNMEKKKGTTREDRSARRNYFPLIGFKRLLPEMAGYCLVYSDSLSREVSVNRWTAEHAAVDEEEQMLRSQAINGDISFSEGDAWMDMECESDDGNTFQPPENTRCQRTEKLNGEVLASELTRLRGKKLSPLVSELEKRWLDWLEEANRVAMPLLEKGCAPPAERMLTVVYGKSREIGRRTASHPSYQHCPSTLRPLLAGSYYHDVDMVNCHPSLFLQVATKMGVAAEVLTPLHDYVTDRDAVLHRIGEWYGVPAKRCKYAVLRVLNGGSMFTWIKDAKCTRNAISTRRDHGQAARQGRRGQALLTTVRPR